MMNRPLLICVHLVTAAAASGCAFDPLLVGAWSFVQREQRVGDEEDWRDVSQPCHSDDIEEYDREGGYVVYAGTSRCEGSTDADGISTGTWRLAAADTKIVYTYDGFTGEYESTIEELDEERLILTFATGDLAGTQNRTTHRRSQ